MLNADENFMCLACMSCKSLGTCVQAEAEGSDKHKQAGEKMTLQMEDLVSALNEHVRAVYSEMLIFRLYILIH